MGALPLLHQPGAAWRYDLGASVLGVLLARAADAPLPDVVRELVLAPVGMAETTWTVGEPALDELPPAYAPDERGRLSVVDPGGRQSAWSEPPVFPDGASGLVSTVGDLLAFARTLLDGGRTPSGTTVVDAELVARMTTDQLTAEQRAQGAPFLDGGGWGFGVGVDERGRYGWVGGYGTAWRNDPSTGRVELVLSQRVVFPAPTTLFADVWEAAAQLADAPDG